MAWSALRSENGSTAIEALVAVAAPAGAFRRHRAKVPATASSATTASVATSGVARARGMAAALGVALRCASSASAREKSPQLANRSAGALASARCTAASTPALTAARAVRMLRGVSVISRAMITCAVAPVCGGSPLSISYVIAPSAY